MIAGFLSTPETIEVPCTLDVEITPDSVHAHAVPEGITLRPGDTVLVHGVPDRLEFGQKFTLSCTATVTRAGFLKRLATRLAAIAEITELYEVSFAPMEKQP